MEHSMFKKHTGSYVYNPNADLMVDDYICFPLEVDTEYQIRLTEPDNLDTPICENLTVQYRNVYQPTGVIYAHPENTVARHKVFKHDFSALDYLEDLGHAVELYRGDSGHDAELPIFQFDLYSYFAVAELLRIFMGEIGRASCRERV